MLLSYEMHRSSRGADSSWTSEVQVSDNAVFHYELHH